MAKRQFDRADAFGQENQPSASDMANEIYGKPAPDLATGRVVARPVSLGEILADLRQPRRAVPARLRSGWAGDSEGLEDVLREWHLLAGKWGGGAMPHPREFFGQVEPHVADGMPPFVQGWVDLLRLASTIKRDGLINPISVVRDGAGYVIEAGERRWIAYHLICMYYDPHQEQWGRIPAIVADGMSNVWRQATENTARRNLNAIQMARQLALLIMEARVEDNGADTLYLAYDEAMREWKSDRLFYAQVADGNVHRIPRGYGERIAGAMGLSTDSLRRYRALLKLTADEMVNDALWMRADDEDWSEGFLRALAGVDVGRLRGIVSRHDWGRDEVEGLVEPRAKDGYTVPIGTVSPTMSTPTRVDLGRVATPPPSHAPTNGEGERLSDLGRVPDVPLQTIDGGEYVLREGRLEAGEAQGRTDEARGHDTPVPPRPYGDTTSDKADSAVSDVLEAYRGIESAEGYMRDASRFDLNFLLAMVGRYAERHPDDGGYLSQFIGDIERLNARTLELQIERGLERDKLLAYLGDGEKAVAQALAALRAELGAYLLHIMTEYDRITEKAE